MACLKLGSKPDALLHQGQEWFCASGLASDITITVQDQIFHLHKFPLVSRSRKFVKLLEEFPDKDKETVHLELLDIPGGPYTFELAARFCYGLRMEITASNAVPLRCAAEYLAMTEDLGEGNLIVKTDGFISQVVLRHWKESTRALRSCETVFPHAEELGLVNMCVEAVAMKACTDPDLLGWPMLHSSMQSPGGSLLWNGISTGAKPRKSQSDWWYEDVAILGLALYKRLIVAVKARGMGPESIAGALMHFGKKYLLDPNKLQAAPQGSRGHMQCGGTSATDQKLILETIESLLPVHKNVVPTNFLSSFLRIAMMLNTSVGCKSNLERRIGLQLEQASLEDMLFPNLSYSIDTLYDTDCTQRILDHFLLLDQSAGIASSPSSVDEGPLISSPSLTPVMMVARLMDGYLAEVAPDVNLKPAKFLSLAAALPDYARICDDGLYRAIDIYLKAHPWIREDEREQLCRIMDCQKLSLEACTHAAQNERLPLRIIVQVLFFEQLQLRTAIASCFMMSDNSRPLRNQVTSEGPMPAAARGDEWSTAIHNNQVLKVDIENMKLRVNDLEKECTGMRQEIEKLGKFRGNWRLLVSKTMGGRFRSHVCKIKGTAVQDHTQPSEPSDKSTHFRRSSCT